MRTNHPKSEGTVGTGIRTGFLKNRSFRVEFWKDLWFERQREHTPGWGRRCPGNEPEGPAETKGRESVMQREPVQHSNNEAHHH